MYSNPASIVPTNNNVKNNYYNSVQFNNYSNAPSSNFSYNYNKVDFDKEGVNTNNSLNSSNITNYDINKNLQNLNMNNFYSANTNNFLVSSGNNHIKPESSIPINLNQNVIYTLNASNILVSSGNNNLKTENPIPVNLNQNIIHSSNTSQINPNNYQASVYSNILNNSLYKESNGTKQNNNKIKKFCLNDFIMRKTLGKGKINN